MRISDWSSDVCSSDLKGPNSISYYLYQPSAEDAAANPALDFVSPFLRQNSEAVIKEESKAIFLSLSQDLGSMVEGLSINASGRYTISDEHTSELQSLIRTSYAVLCLKTNITITNLS